MLARPAGYGMECADLGSWLFLLGHHIAKAYPEVDPCIYQRRDNRIAMMRNNCVKASLEAEAGYMLMIDPDARMDAYVKRGDAKNYVGRFRPFFDEAWSFMQAHRIDHPPCVLAAPACGPPPENAVQVFKQDERGRLVKLTRDEAAEQTGWTRVGAVGTHAMLIDMRVFDRMDHPYFDDIFTDNTHTELKRGQDVYFCRNCMELDIPVLVNFDCWTDHWQNVPIPMPGADGHMGDLMGQVPSPRRRSSPPPPPTDTENKPPNFTCWE